MSKTAKEFLEDDGYDFSDEDFWMEEILIDFKVKDLISKMEKYASQQKPQAIEWIKHKEIRDNVYPAINGLYGTDCGTAFILGANWLQSELKTRIKPESDLQKEVDRLRYALKRVSESINSKHFSASTMGWYIEQINTRINETLNQIKP